MHSLKTDVLCYISSFLDPLSIIRLASVNRNNRRYLEKEECMVSMKEINHAYLTNGSDRLANCILMSKSTWVASKLLIFYAVEFIGHRYDEVLRVSIGSDREIFEVILTILPIDYKISMLEIMPLAMECADKHYFYRMQSMWNQQTWINNVKLGRPDYYAIAATCRKNAKEAMRFAEELSTLYELPKVNLLAFECAKSNLDPVVLDALEKKFPDTADYIKDYHTVFKRKKPNT